MAYESLSTDAAASPAAVEDFTRLMWPQGNSTFRDAVVGFAAPLQDLVGIVQRMILESLGIVEEECFDVFVGSVSYRLRLSEYGVPPDQETEVGMGSHVDPDFVTVVCQNRAGGLQVETREGDWVDVVLSPDSVTVMIGQAFQAWTNGKFRAPVHRVKMVEKKKRFSALYGSSMSTGVRCFTGLIITATTSSSASLRMKKAQGSIHCLLWNRQRRNSLSSFMMKQYCAVFRESLLMTDKVKDRATTRAFYLK